MPSAVIFDMDGVLVDSEPIHTEGYVRTFNEMGLKLDNEGYRQSVILGNAGVRNLYTSIGGDMKLWPDVCKRKASILRELVQKHGRLMPGVIQLLETLKREEISTVLATSASKKSFSIMMEKFDLTGFFDHIITWEDVNAIKPDPAVFILAAERLGAKREECVIFEDSPRGVLAAHRAGIKCIAVPNFSTSGGDFTHASMIVNSLTEVTIEMLRGMF